MPVGVYDQIKQQTFLGASVVNFSANLGLNGSPSELTVNLVEDIRNNTFPPHCTDPAFITENDCVGAGKIWRVPDRTFIGNRKGEGYHYSKTSAADVAPANIMTGKYPDDDYNGLDHTKFREPQLAGMGQLPGYDKSGLAFNDVKGNLLYKYGDYFCPPPLGSPVWFNFHLYDDRGNQNPLPISLMNGTEKSTFNGILTNYSIKQSSSGRSISVQVADPRLILEGVQVILDGYKDMTPPGDWSTNTITTENHRHPANGQPSRKLHHGYNGYYNILNVYGYYENYFLWQVNTADADHEEKARQTGDDLKPLSGSNHYNKGVRSTSGYGMADVNEGGMRWYDSTNNRKVNVAPDGNAPQLEDAPGFPSIFVALQHMLMGWPTLNVLSNMPGVGGNPALAASPFYDDSGNESLGGPIYYVVKERLDGLGVPQTSVVNTITEPKNVYRFKVDLSDMLKLTDPVRGVPALPRYYRVKASSMSLLELIQHVCEDAHADFIVELLPDTRPPLDSFEDRSLDGILKVKIIDKREKPDTTIIAREIRKAEWALGRLGAAGVAVPRQHQWYNRIVDYDMGKEFATEPAGKMVIGGPETRVVGADLRIGVDRIDHTKCACIKDESIKNQVHGTPVIPPAGAPTRAWCEAQGDEFHWRCARRPTEFDGVQLPGVYRLDNNGAWGQIGRDITGNNNVYTNDWRMHLDPENKGGYFSDFNPDYDGSDRNDVNTTTNITVVDNSPSITTGGAREIWCVWGDLVHEAQGGAHGVHSQYVGTDVDHEYDYCNAETGHCRFERGYGDIYIDSNGRFIPKSKGTGDLQTQGFINRAGGVPIYNKDFRQDYRTDIFPCWGFFNTYENETIAGVVGDEDVVITDAAVPIKGSFDEMNPYRDFHPYYGIGASFMHVLVKPLREIGQGGLGRNSGKRNSDGEEMYDSVEYCIEKLVEEAIAAGEEIGDNYDKYIRSCNPHYGNRVYGYARDDYASSDRTATTGLDKQLENGVITSEEYTKIVKGYTERNDVEVWNALEQVWVKDISISEPTPVKVNGKFLRPKTATIPIDLREAGIQNKVTGGMHFATVTELRHAIVGLSSWKDYIRNFDPLFAEDIGLESKGAAHLGTMTETVVATDENGLNPTLAEIFQGQSISAMDTSYGVLRSTAVHPDDNEHQKIIEKIYAAVKNVADNYYGKQFLVPLPYDPQRLTEYEKRTYVDDEQKIPAYKISNKWDIAQAGWVEKETNLASANTAGGENAAARKAGQQFTKYPQDKRFFNAEGLLEPYMVFPHKVWADIKQTIETLKLAMPGPTTFQLDRPITTTDDNRITTKNQCPVCDNDAWKRSGRDARDSSHSYQSGDSDGKFSPMVFANEQECRQYYQDAQYKFTKPAQDRESDGSADSGVGSCWEDNSINCDDIDPSHASTKMSSGMIDQKTSNCNFGWIQGEEERIKLSFEPLDFTAFDRNDYYIESQRTDDPAQPYCTNAGFGDQISCEDQNDARKTPDGQPWDVIPGRWITNNAYLTRVFVKADVDEKTHWLESDIYNQHMIVPPDGRGSQESSTGFCSDSSLHSKEDCEQVGEAWANFNQLRPYGLIKLNSVVGYPKDTIIGPAAMSFGGASIATNLNRDMSFFGHTELLTKMAPAAFKPWEGAVPQQSNISSWGPWSNGSHFGAARYEEDSSLSPQEYGGTHGMNLAGSARAGLDAIEFQEQESGSVSITGLPETPLGGSLFRNALGVKSPVITNISVNIDTGGIKTSYRMETYKRQMGRDEMHKIQRNNRIRKAQFAREKEARDNRRYRNRPKKD